MLYGGFKASDYTPYCCFLLLMKFMSITRHEVPLVYFGLTKTFHTIFGVSNSEHSIHAIVAIQFVFPLFLASTQINADTIQSYVQKQTHLPTTN